MKILLPILALLQFSNASASLIAVMDSGSDTTHSDLAPKAWKNVRERAGNFDMDGDGLPGDVFGFDFTTNTPNPFDAQYNYLITSDVKKFYDYMAKYDLGSLNQLELAWLQATLKNPKLMNDADFVGGYIHGTHVAGISLKDNPKAKVLPLKILPTFYTAYVEPKVGPTPTPNGPKVIAPKVDTTPTMSIDQLKSELVKETNDYVSGMLLKHKILKFHKVDAVNQSFGIGFVNAVDMIKSFYIETQKKMPTDLEVDSLARLYMRGIVSNGTKIYQSVPNAVFCVAAGNDGNDNDKNPDFPSGVVAENLISVAATQGYVKFAEFSNYGVNTVDVAAPGVAISSTSPTNTYIPLSGTSQAAPLVTNLVARIKDVNPKLIPRDIKAIVLATVDVKPWLKDKVRTSGIVNMARALKAAEYTLTMSLDNSIIKSKSEVPDNIALMNKSLPRSKTSKVQLDFRWKRPSLLVPNFEL